MRGLECKPFHRKKIGLFEVIGVFFNLGLVEGKISGPSGSGVLQYFCTFKG